jgi:Kef-type K+ transport system membrane component KefB
MELLYVLLILLLTTRLCGELAERIGQPALVGELVSGIALGAVATTYSGTFPVLSELPELPAFNAITDLGVFFLMLLAGCEMRPRDLARATSGALPVAVGGLMLPLVLGAALGAWALPASDAMVSQMLFLGTALAITAVPVSVKVLMDLGQLDSAVGRLIVSAALFDDVLSLVLLAVLTAVIETGALPDAAGLALLLGKIVLFFLIAGVIGMRIFPYLGRVARRLRGAEFEFSFLLVAALGYAVLAELLSMHFIIGAFVAGLFFVRRTIDPDTHEDVTAKVRAMSSGFLAPLFFASIGFHLDGRAIVEIPGFVLLLVAVATAGKLLGAGIPARLTGLSRRDAIAVGVGMNARGAVELIIAGIALRAGLFEIGRGAPIVDGMYSAIVITAVVTTLATPVVLKLLFRQRGAAPS